MPWRTVARAGVGKELGVVMQGSVTGFGLGAQEVGRGRSLLRSDDIRI
jgi:hypothetical protein